MNTSEVLNRAADLIEERGWRYGAGWIIEGLPEKDRNAGNAALCLEGGIQAAAGIVIRAQNGSVPDELFEPLMNCPAYTAVQAHLGVRNQRDDGTMKRLWTWNDRQSTDSSVIEVLRACAVIEAAKEDDSALALLDVPVAGVGSVRVAAGEASS